MPKYHPRTETIGTIDEASAALGVARAACQLPASRELIITIQRDLYHMMAEVAATPENAARFRMIDAARVDWVETQTDDLGGKVEMPREFILPGDSTAGANLALARAIIRRAERLLAQLIHSGEVENGDTLRYLNRLSSLCFLLELAENSASGKAQPTLARD